MINEERHLDLITRLRETHRKRSLSLHAATPDRTMTLPSSKKKTEKKQETTKEIKEMGVESKQLEMLREEFEKLDEESRDLLVKFLELKEANVPEEQYDGLLGEGWRAHLGDAAAMGVGLAGLAGGLAAAWHGPTGLEGVPIAMAGGIAGSAIQDAGHRWDMRHNQRMREKRQSAWRKKNSVKESAELAEGKRWKRFKKAWRNTSADSDIDFMYHTIGGLPIARKSFPHAMLSSLKHPDGKFVAGMNIAAWTGHPAIGGGLMAAGAVQKGYRVAKEYRRLKRLGEDTSEIEDQLINEFGFNEESFAELMEMKEEEFNEIENQLDEEAEAEEELTPGDYIIAAALEKKPADVAKIFDMAVKEAASEMLDQYRDALASEMFSPPEDEEVPADDDEGEEEDDDAFADEDEDDVNEEIEDLDEERKEHAAATKAFLSGGRFKSKRRSVENGEYKLHGHTIAYHKEGKVHATMAGWPTVTTRGSLNHLARAMGAPGFRQKGGKQYHGDHVINANDHVVLHPRINEDLNEGFKSLMRAAGTQFKREAKTAYASGKAKVNKVGNAAVDKVAQNTVGRLMRREEVEPEIRRPFGFGKRSTR